MHDYRIAIVGGSGFIGSALADSLSKSFDVRIVDKRRPAVGSRIDFTECDIRIHDDLKRALEGVDLAINTAIVQIPQINENSWLGYGVNVVGTQNLCEIVRNSASLRGLILAGTWHTIGEKHLNGVIDERFGFRPDMVEDRARIYALSKIAQESIVRLYDEAFADKIYGVIRIGTVLGLNMPEKTAARIFIDQAIMGRTLTPYDYSLYRPMLYVDIRDACRAFESYASMILNNSLRKKENSLADIVNVYYPKPMTILELAETVAETVLSITNGQIKPEITVVRTGQAPQFAPEDKDKIEINVSRALDFLGLKKLTSPAEAIREIIEKRITSLHSVDSLA